MNKKVLIFFGFLSLGLGLIGSILPLLPTTPFLLLSAFFFSKSSERWYNWLIRMPKIGVQIQDWNEHGVISNKSKVICIISIVSVTVWLTIYSTYGHIIKTVIPTILVLLLGFILTRPNYKNK